MIQIFKICEYLARLVVLKEFSNQKKDSILLNPFSNDIYFLLFLLQILANPKNNEGPRSASFLIWLSKIVDDFLNNVMQLLRGYAYTYHYH